MTTYNRLSFLVEKLITLVFSGLLQWTVTSLCPLPQIPTTTEYPSFWNHWQLLWFRCLSDTPPFSQTPRMTDEEPSGRNRPRRQVHRPVHHKCRRNSRTWFQVRYLIHKGRFTYEPRRNIRYTGRWKTDVVLWSVVRWKTDFISWSVVPGLLLLNLPLQLCKTTSRIQFGTE